MKIMTLLIFSQKNMPPQVKERMKIVHCPAALSLRPFGKFKLINSRAGVSVFGLATKFSESLFRHDFFTRSKVVFESLCTIEKLPKVITGP